MANLSNINNKFLVTTTGEVLIGQTSNNGNRLQITGADGASYIYLKTDVATTGGRIGFNGDDLRVFNQQASGELQLGTAGVSRVRISNSLVVFPTITELRGDIATKFAIGNMGGASSQMMVSSRGFLTFNVSNTGSALDATERMRIDSSGNTTITTTFNQGGLTVTSATDNTVLGINNTATGGQNWRLQSIGGGSGSGQGKLLIKVGGGETAANIISFVTDGSGADIKMGIGTTDPGNYKLKVIGAVSGTNVYANSNGGSFVFGASTSEGEYITRQSGTSNMSFYTDSSPRLTILSGGNVGIGTTSPSAKLEVKAPDTASTTDYATKVIKAVAPLVGGYTGTKIISLLGGFDGAIHAVDFGYGYNTTGYDMMLSTNDNTSGNPIERMRITSAGNAIIYGGLTVGATSQVAGTQVAIVGGGGTNLQRWGSTSNGALQASYRFRIDQSFKFIANNGSGDNLTIDSSNGSIIPSGGIYLGGTGASDLLDDYEEGTFTATTNNDGVGAQVTANYTKIGRLVTFTIYYPNISPTVAGTGVIAGLPFSIISSNGYGQGNVTHSTAIINCSGGYMESTNWNATQNNSTGRASWVVASARSIMVSGFYYTTA